MINVGPRFSLLFLVACLLWEGLSGRAAEPALIAPSGYMPGMPFVVRVELRDSAGALNKMAWDADAILTATQGVQLSTNRVRLRNGLGTALLTVTTNVNFILAAEVNGQVVSRALRTREGEEVTTTSGVLSGTDTAWRGVIHVTGDLTVPKGHTLTIEPDTIVMVDGIASGTNGIRIVVEGSIRSLGTVAQPVVISSTGPLLNWGQIVHLNAETSAYNYTFISKAGRIPGEGHTGSGPAFRIYNSAVSFENCVISDLTSGGESIGKVMMATGSSLVFEDTVLTRARMGPEIANTGLVCTNSYILDMHGPDDADGLYLHEAGGRSLLVTDCVIAGGDDDAIDTFDSRAVVENCILRDWSNPNEDAKGVSSFNGEVILRRCLIVNCFAGVSAKSNGPLGTVRLDHCTIMALDRGVSAATKSNATAGNLAIYMTNCIVRANDSLYSDFGPERFISVSYCNLGESWPGTGNSAADPLFVDAAAGDFRLRPGSPCMDAGDPAFALDADASPTDVGFHTGETWSEAPEVSGRVPAAGLVRDLSEVIVTFSKPVIGVDAADLLIRGIPAVHVEGSSNVYRFVFPRLSPGLAPVHWSSSHGITDTLIPPTPFFADVPEASWTYEVAPSTLGNAGLVINEIMYHPGSEDSREDYIELFNDRSTPVNLDGWRFTDGVEFTFPDIAVPAGGYLVVAADLETFRRVYPEITNVVGGWTGSLSNSGEEIELSDAGGNRVQRVRYADEGEWAVRQRGALDRGYRGWRWFAAHDGLGKSAELINPHISNHNGQNWAASRIDGGTPGRLNSVYRAQTAPLIENVSHAPLVPGSSNTVIVTALIRHADRAEVHYRVDSMIANPFQMVDFRDDGQAGDAVAGDGIFSATLPAQTNNTVVEFYVTASDEAGLTRTWPSAPMPPPEGNLGTETANALYQVDDSQQTTVQPLYKIIMREAERMELQAIGSNVGGSANSDAQMNATFISLDGTGSELRYLAGVRNRGHGTRARKPNNYRVNFRSDQPWKGVAALNLNAQYSWLQVLGSAINLKSGVVGAYSRAVQVRVNNANLTSTGATNITYGSYAANEAINSDWADSHFPDDDEGNVYRAIRDLQPPHFDYRTQQAYPFLFGPENKSSYTNTWFKETNVSEDDWSDLIAMLRVMGPNGTEPFTPENVRRVINAEQWIRHLAVMNLLGNAETGLNGGYNDDYFMYRGVKDPRFVLMYYDLDQILGFNGSFLSTSSLFTSTNANGAGQAIGRLLNTPEFQLLYYETLRELIETSFSAAEFNALVDQVLGAYVPLPIRAQIKSWMDARRAYVLTQLPPAQEAMPRAALNGPPRSPTPRTTATFQVSGRGITHYRYSLNEGAYSGDIPVGTPLTLVGLSKGTNRLNVIARNSAGQIQSTNFPTSVSWVVDPTWPGVRLNEFIAQRSANQRDLVELYNESAVPVNLSGFRLSDHRLEAARYVFPEGTVLAPGAYLVLDSAQLGFSLNASGEELCLFDRSGTILDFVEFGPQLLDYSVGRADENGEWTLSQATFGGVNVDQPLGTSTDIRINEWLAAGTAPYPDDFVELYNPGSLPVALGGHYLTDRRTGAPSQYRIPPLTFIAGEGHLYFSSGAGDHARINFSLPSEQGEITLFDPQLSVVDSVVYGPQRTGVSFGRCPDGGPVQKALLSPTPGASNQCPLEPPPQAVSLMLFDHVWKFNGSGSDLGIDWIAPSHDDSDWLSGSGLLGFENNSLAEPLLTTIANSRLTTYYFRAYFHLPEHVTVSAVELTHLVDDGAAFYLNGAEIGRFRLPPGATAQTFATVNGEADYQIFSVSPALLRPGTNVLAVEVHQVDPASDDLVLGVQIDALITTNKPGESTVVINEILARNSVFRNQSGHTPGWVELYNPSSRNVDLAGMTLSTDPAGDRSYAFPTGSLLEPGGFLRLDCDGSLSASRDNSGFDLDAHGGSLYLRSAPTEGGRVVSLVTYGIQAVDWAIGRFPDGGTNWVLTIPTPGAANTEAILDSPTRLKVNEWLANPIDGDDWFEIHNTGAHPVALGGLSVSDSLTSLGKTRFPGLSFIGIGSRGFLELLADNQPELGPTHMAFALSAGGEALAISDENGLIIDSVTFGPQSEGVAEGRLPDGSVSRTVFRSPSPGFANFLPLEGIVINEVLTHTDPPLEDAVELYNASNVAVDISGWFLSDSALNLRKYQFGPGTIVAPGSFLVVYEGEFNSPAAMEPFAFDSGDGDEVFLSEAISGQLTGYRASARFGAARNGVSFGRVETSGGADFVALAARTFGQDNPALVEVFRTGRGASNAPPLVGPVVITEIMYDPPGLDESLEFVRIRNITQAAVPLFDPTTPSNTWRITGGVELMLPQLTLDPGEVLTLVDFDPGVATGALASFLSIYGPAGRLVGPFDGNLNNSGETLQLQAPDTPESAGGEVPYVTIDRVDYSDRVPWPTLTPGANQLLRKRTEAAFGNEPLNWEATTVSLRPRLSLRRSGNRTVEIQFNAAANFAYQLLSSSRISGPWQVLQEIPAGSSRVETLSINADNQAAFYVVRQK